MPTGYMPARKKPVKNRKERILANPLPSQITPKLNNAPKTAQQRNTLDGEKRSAIDKMANTKVPMINPNCTAEVKCPTALSLNPKVATRSRITPLPANQSEVQQNCDNTITGSMILEVFIQGFYKCFQFLQLEASKYPLSKFSYKDFKSL